MGADASIYSMIRQPQPQADPIAQYGNVLQLKTLMGQQGLQDLQRQQIERGVDKERRIGELFASGRKPTAEEIMAIDVGKGLEFGKNQREVETHDATLKAKRMETFAKAAGVLKDRLPTVRDDATYQQYKEMALQLLGPDEVAKFNLPATFDPNWVRNQVVKAEELFTPKPTQVKMPDGSIKTVDMNPFTNPQAVNFSAPAGMTPAERDASQRGWAQVNQPVWSDERGVFVQRPGQGPKMGGSVMGGAAPVPAGPVAPVGAPVSAQPPAGPAVIAPAGLPKSKNEIKAEEEKRKVADRLKLANTKADIVIGAVDKALGQAGFNTTGLIGASLGKVPGTDAFDLRKTVTTIKANIGFQELQAMREASPTGGALGQVAIQELEALQSVLASIDADQSTDQLKENLRKVKTHYENWKRTVAQAGGATDNPEGNVEATKKIGNVEFVKINGQWYSR